MAQGKPKPPKGAADLARRLAALPAPRHAGACSVCHLPRDVLAVVNTALRTHRNTRVQLAAELIALGHADMSVGKLNNHVVKGHVGR